MELSATRRVLALSLTFGLVAACGSEDPDSDTQTQSAQQTPGDSVGAAGGEAMDPGPNPDIDPATDPTRGGTVDCEGFVLDEGTFTVQPGEDINYCVRLPIPEPWNEIDLALEGWNWELANTHHYFMEHSPVPHPDPEAGVVPCNADGSQSNFTLTGSLNDEGATIAFGAGEGKGHTTTEQGYGKFLPGGGHFRTSHHVINFSDEPIEVGGKFKVCVGDAKDTPHLMNSMICVTAAIFVPGPTGSVTHTCTATEPIDMILLASHGHQHLTRFTMQYYDGVQTHDELLYESFDWDSPNITALEEPLRLNAGQGITYTCHYEGTGPVFFQDNATHPDAEHCGAFLGYAYPPEREYEVPPRVFSLAILPNQVVPSTESPDWLVL